MEFFVPPHSIVRRIWGRSDTIMLIFAGAAAEFALNKAVDWLYFTGRLPADPLGRLFSTVSYAQRIIFSEKDEALRAIDAINAIHGNIEKDRGIRIPEWAYRDVLYLLIHYSQAAFEVLERKMTPEEKDDLMDVFLRVGERMQLSGLPATYAEWVISRNTHIEHDLAFSKHTADLFKQYRKHLGSARYQLLTAVQRVIVPRHARAMLRQDGISWLSPLLFLYRNIRWMNVDGLLTAAALPAEFRHKAASLTPAAG